MAISFKGAHFPKEIIRMGVRWYVAYPLSTRHVEELMGERGVELDHATINRWVIKYSPQLELILKAWKSSLHLAALTTTKAASTLCHLYGRMLLILLNSALCPQTRAALWEKKPRAVSVLKLVRHFQAFAARWMQAIFQSAFELRRFLQHVCATAERLVSKAVRQRRTTVPLLRESV